MTLKELKSNGYKTISSLKKIDNSIRPEHIPDSLKTNGIQFGSGWYYPEETIQNTLNYFFNTSVEDKTKIHSLEKYGTEYSSQNKEIKEKVKQTNLDKYGVSCYLNSNNFVKLKYGVDNISQIKEIRNKAKQTNLSNHNGKYNTQTEEYLEKREQTWKLKYGVDNISQLDSIKLKKEQTCISNYGIRNPAQSDKIDRTRKIGTILFDNIRFDSTWEMYYYFYLKNNNIPFIYHPTDKEFWYIKDSKNHRYFPDFKVYDRYVEIKGNHLLKVNPFTGESLEEKMNYLKENNVLILTKEDIIPFKKYFNENYLQKFKKVI